MPNVDQFAIALLCRQCRAAQSAALQTVLCGSCTYDSRVHDGTLLVKTVASLKWNPGGTLPEFHLVITPAQLALCYWSAATVVGLPSSPRKTTSSLVAVSATLNA